MDSASHVSDARRPFTQVIPGATARIDFVPIPGTDYWIAATETPWEAYDAFVFGEEESTPGGGDDEADAVSRPSKPYLPPDRGFGHEGYPAMSITFHGAEQFCRWLSQETGKTFRLPTVAEWEHACKAGRRDDVPLADRAWFAANSDRKTHAIGSRMANRFGLFDMKGNVAEWCRTETGQPVAKGGSYLDEAEKLACDVHLLQTPSWNASDPQFPKSRWWLADAPFVGFRIVYVPPETQEEN